MKAEAFFSSDTPPDQNSQLSGNELVKVYWKFRKIIDDKMETEKYLRSSLDTLEKLQEKLIAQEKDALIGSVATGIAHDFNNILNMINEAARAVSTQIKKGNGQLANDELMSIRKTCQLGSGIIESIQLSQSLSKIPTETKPFQLVETIFTLLKGSTLEKFVLENNIPQDLLIKTVEALLYRAFLNVIRNSIEASESTASKKIIVSSHKDGNFLIFSFQDFGSGISQENMKKIFTKFSSKYSGMGIGLKMIKQELESIGGKIEVKNRENPTEIVIILPWS